MTKDLMQAYAEVLMNDQERFTYKHYRRGLSLMSLGLGGMVPFGFIIILRPGVMDAFGGARTAKIFWAAYGLFGLGAGFLAHQQHTFLDQVSEKYFGQLTDDQVRKYRALYESDMRY